MIYYVYMITNNLNGMRYIGKRAYNGTDISKDKYMGSSKHLKASIRKHGIENYTKQIIEICDSECEVFKAEKWWTNAYDAVKNPMFYNKKDGGAGGDSWVGKTDEEKEEFRQRMKEIKSETSEATRQRMHDSQTKNVQSEGYVNSFKGKHHTEEAKEKNRQKHIGKPSSFKGKHHTEETKEKMRKPKTQEHKDKLSKSLMGNVPANKGMHWYNDGENNVMAFECPKGFTKGVIRKKG